MLRKRLAVRLVATLAIALTGSLISGCTQYFKVTDISTGKTYYATKLSRQKAGAVQLKDARSGAAVTLQSSEVRKISKDTFNEETR